MTIRTEFWVKWKQSRSKCLICPAMLQKLGQDSEHNWVSCLFFVLLRCFEFCVLFKFQIRFYKMQCIRTKRRRSSGTSSLSEESFNTMKQFFERSNDRKSFLRRSFDRVRKKVLRRSVHLTWNGSRSEKNWLDNDDHNNNSTNTESNAAKPFTYGEGDALSISTDCDMPDSKSHHKRSQEP